MFQSEVERVRARIAAEVAALAKLREAAKPHEETIAQLRAYEASLLTANALSDLNATPSRKERYDNAEVLFWATLQRRPLAKALRQLFNDSAPDEYDRESIFSLVTSVMHDAKETTVYSTLSRLVAEGAVEKTETGYRGIPK